MCNYTILTAFWCATTTRTRIARRRVLCSTRQHRGPANIQDSDVITSALFSTSSSSLAYCDIIQPTDACCIGNIELCRDASTIGPILLLVLLLLISGVNIDFGKVGYIRTYNDCIRPIIILLLVMLLCMNRISLRWLSSYDCGRIIRIFVLLFFWMSSDEPCRSSGKTQYCDYRPCMSVRLYVCHASELCE